MVDLDEAGTARRWTKSYPAPLELRAVVEYTWLQRLPRRGRPALLRIVPDPSPHLIAHRTRGGMRIALVGARSVSTDVVPTAREWTVGLRFAPGTIPRLVGVSAAEITDRSVSVAELFGATGFMLVERACEAGAAELVQQLLLDFVYERIRRAPPLDRRVLALTAAAAAAVREAPGAAPARIPTVARRAGIAERTARNLFHGHIGLGPNRALRVHRVLRAARELIERPRTSGSAVAHRTGFCDQSHLIREFQALLGETPEAFRSRAAARP